MNLETLQNIYIFLDRVSVTGRNEVMALASTMHEVSQEISKLQAEQGATVKPSGEGKQMESINGS